MLLISSKESDKYSTKYCMINQDARFKILRARIQRPEVLIICIRDNQSTVTSRKAMKRKDIDQSTS